MVVGFPGVRTSTKPKALPSTARPARVMLAPLRAASARRPHLGLAEPLISGTLHGVEAGGEFYDEDFFRTLAASGARALLIGRRALIALGAPVIHLILTKRWGSRPRDLVDIEWLTVLKGERDGPR